MNDELSKLKTQQQQKSLNSLNYILKETKQAC